MKKVILCVVVFLNSYCLFSDDAELVNAAIASGDCQFL
jgi:hypothetical protein